MKTAMEVAQLFWQHLVEDGGAKRRMQEVAEAANGDMAIPLPELNALDKAAVANYTHIGIQQMSQRLTSVQPVVRYPPLQATPLARKQAKMRGMTQRYWDLADRQVLLDAQLARYLFGYGTAPQRIDVNLGEHRPFTSITSPLTTYCPRPAQVNDIHPVYGIAAKRFDAATIHKRWGYMPEVSLMLKDRQPREERWVIEYADADETTLVLCGEAHKQNSAFETPQAHGEAVMLSQVPNRAGVSPWVVPGLIHLDRPQGHFDQIMGAYMAEGLLNALSLQQAARSVFPETWVVARPNEMPNIVTPADPIRGVVGQISGASLETITPVPQYSTNMQQDRLAETQRQNAGLPSDFSGMAGQGIRTGRRAAQLIESAVDPTLGEAQTSVAIAKELICELRAKYDKAYFKQSKTYFLDVGDRQAKVTYTPENLWVDGARGSVKYPVTGSDVNSLTILTGQMVGTGLISTGTARKMHPFVPDADYEHDMITREKLESVFLDSLAAKVQDPADPFQAKHWARLNRMITDQDIPLLEAYEQLEAEVQAEQAEQVQPGTPEAMPGLDGPGAIPPAIAGPQPAQQNLASLMGALRMPERQVQLSSGGRA